MRARAAESSESTGPERAELDPFTRLDTLLTLALGLLALRLYQGSAPGVVNLDGLGYVKLLPHNFAAGHLLYMPLLRMTTALCHGQGLDAGRLVSAVAAAVAVALFYRAARALLARPPALLGTAGLIVSYAVWVQGSDVEAYACALAAQLGVLTLALAYRTAPGLLRAFNLGLALAGAVLFHLTHVLLTPFVVLWAVAHGATRRCGLRDGLFAACVGGAVTLASYAWACFGVRHLDTRGAIKWVATAGHGFLYQGNLLWRIADATYGLARSYVWSPYLYESNAQKLIAHLLLGLAPLVLIGIVLTTRRAALAHLPWRLLLVWMAPYVAMAFLFFGADHERWVFVHPPLWLLTAAALTALPSPQSQSRGLRWGTALVAYLALTNAATAIGPARIEVWDRTRADVATALMKDRDLVLFPGHSWDEYIGFYTGTRIVPFPLAYYAGRDGKGSMIARLDREVKKARARGARIYAVRLFDDKDDQRGFYELETLDLPRPALLDLLTRFQPVPLATTEPKVTVWRLDDKPAP